MNLWWVRKESNLRPRSYQERVLPLNYAPIRFILFERLAYTTYQERVLPLNYAPGAALEY